MESTSHDMACLYTDVSNGIPLPPKRPNRCMVSVALKGALLAAGDGLKTDVNTPFGSCDASPDPWSSKTLLHQPGGPEPGLSESLLPGRCGAGAVG
jgi:hypothetical protein